MLPLVTCPVPHAAPGDPPCLMLPLVTLPVPHAAPDFSPPPMMTHTAPDFPPCTYYLQLGEGGYGTVYSGKFYNTDVAIKVGHPLCLYRTHPA